MTVRLVLSPEDMSRLAEMVEVTEWNAEQDSRIVNALGASRVSPETEESK